MKVYRLPRWAPMVGWTFLCRVWLKPGCEGALPHELVHVAQQRRDGWRFYLRYAFLPSWRVRYEVEAYRVDIAAGRRTVEQAARSISGSLYLWPCGYAEAVAQLRG